MFIGAKIRVFYKVHSVYSIKNFRLSKKRNAEGTNVLYLRKNSSEKDMAKVDQDKMNGDVAQQPRPNRDAYKAMYAEDYPESDFEDKEARYGQMINDRKQLRSYRESGARLNGMLDKNRWLARVLQELASNPDMNPIEVIAESGIDISEAMQDEETRKKVADKLAQYQQKQLDDEGEQATRQKNLENSANALKSLGLSEEETNDLYMYFFSDIVDNALSGIVSPETWQMLVKAKNYDADIKAAKEQSAMQARNEKMTNKVKDFGQQMPPTLSQGTGQKTATKKAPGFFDDIM